MQDIARRQILDEIVAWGSQQDTSETDAAGLLTEFLAIVCKAELPLLRASTWFPTSHPELWGEQVIWDPESGAVAHRRDYTVITTPTYKNTPAEKVYETRASYRCRLDGPADELPYDLLREMQADGATDYYISAFPLFFETGWVSYTAAEPGGFSDDDISFMTSATRVFAGRSRPYVSENSLKSLMEIYLGHNAAERVCDGEFKRGTGTTLPAVLWFCDLRDFTSLSDSLPPQQVVQILDRYFEAVAGPIEDQGGEILKFIGDAVLAVFPCTENPAVQAEAALRSAQQALAAVSELSTVQERESGHSLRIGVGLHRGEVLYGNIGGRSRLDFTVIGAAVNEVCRMEALCKPLGAPLLISEQVAELLPDNTLRPLGGHSVKGVSRELHLFVPVSD